MAEEPNPGSDAPAPDPAMMEQLMKAMGGGGGSGGGEGGGGGMDMAALQAMLGGLGGGGGGLGGGPEAEMRRQAQANQAAQAEKNSGEADGGADGKAYKWEQTSKYGESEIIVRFPLATPATKKDVKVTFKAKALLVVVAGEELLSGATFGTVSVDDSTWCLVEKGAELQVLLGLALDEKWTSLLAA